ncbi:Polyketide cyclase / dehydrase and lipid transport [Pseudomonas sp. 22 E 5]|uniref:SRPBCC family protein n=1 Tax=Pseudomonas asgharzadehiana TaxID=2842349 RepID=A0ABX8P745_9PSED|nr:MULTISPECIES: SRPBCC family protein [Pseudomonas]CRM91196.1 Polyketide cyclase / dehydrase and lipid transport [Pseudomonas sp. 22 E 5]MCX9152985.1 SRPBCC family protein [Pseudomonas sp. TB1-B1]QXH69786.1 SRPBCC family protein [Pseudomonas asgharzadehiana]TKJ59232.1 SRPBCC family protein [Pseudomonas sp. CFBP13506]CRM41809.1 Polyketide cyclase / dehydrase and lipid transport [Pseudomonas sp. 31 E 5]
MPTAFAVIEIPVSADTVWQLVGGFNSLPDWLPLIAKSEPGEGGRLRHLTTADGGTIVERLQTFDNVARTYSYTIEASPFPVSAYLATLQVEALTDTSAKVTWSGVFTPTADITEEAAQELFTGVYQGGLEALRANFPA